MLIASSGVIAQDLQLTSTNDESARWTVALTTGILGSKWQENLSGSSRHVYERAKLPISAVELIRDTDKNLVKFQLKASSGKRGYEGWTSTGQPITSTSDVDIFDIQVEYQWKISPDLSWGFHVEHENFSRQLNGVSNVKGYIENYMGFSLLVGASKIIHFSDGNSLNLSVWYGGGEGHRMKLTLVPYDPSTVKLGSTRKMDVSATWKSPLIRNDQSKWDFIGQLAVTRTDTGQSEVGALRYQGRTAGTFIQPNTESSSWRVSVGLAHTW